MSKELNVAIGARIRACRESLNMNREAFAERVGLSPQFLAEAEGGKKGVSAESIYKICTSCEMSADYLILGRTESANMRTPLEVMLNDVPSKYVTSYTQILNSVNEMIKKAREENSNE